MKQWINIFLALTKFKISFFATLSTFVGFVLAHKGLSREMIFPIEAVFLLASGSCALNQYQERRVDELMKRTKGRPIPSGKLSPSTALKISLFLLLLGSLTLYHGGNWIVLSLGLFAVSWYNGVYTFLKRKTVFAVIPGALVGAIPPVLGWLSAGGDLLDPQIFAVAFFFFIWQIPHFWLLLLNFGRDYETAGFPVFTRIFTPAQLSRITFVWIFATAVACLIIPLFGIVKSQIIIGGLLVAGGWLMWKATRLLIARCQELSFQFTFRNINIYALLVMALLTLDHQFH